MRHKTRRVMRLRQLRRQREWTQEELGRHVGLSGVAISHIEKGRMKPSFNKAIEIAGVFGVPVEQLFDYVEVSA